MGEDWQKEDGRLDKESLQDCWVPARKKAEKETRKEYCANNDGSLFDFVVLPTRIGVL